MTKIPLGCSGQIAAMGEAGKQHCSAQGEHRAEPKVGLSISREQGLGVGSILALPVLKELQSLLVSAFGSVTASDPWGMEHAASVCSA